MESIVNNTVMDNASIPQLLDDLHSTANNTTKLSSLLSGAIFFNTVSFALLVVEAMSLYVMRKCVLIPDQAKMLTQNMLMADMCSHAVSVLWFTVISPIERRTTIGWISTRLRIVTIYVVLLLYCLMVLLVAFDRFIAVQNPLLYEDKLPPMTIKRAVCAVWFLAIGLIWLPSICGLSMYCSLGHCADANKPLPYNQYFRMTMSALFLICDVCVAGFHTYIYSVSGKQAARLNRVFPATQTNRRLPGKRTMVILTAFISLYSPAIIYTVIYDLLRLDISLFIHGVLYIIGFRVCTSLHSCISLYFFMYSMPECRMRFMSTYLSWWKRYTQRISEMKVELFNVRTIQRQ